jgi:agmatine deiminase
MVPDWNTNHVFISDLLWVRHPEIAHSMQSIFEKNHISFGTLRNTADVWARDYAPIQIRPDAFRQFTYHPSYLKCYEDRITPPERCRLDFMTDYRRVPLVLDGGNVVASTNRVILTEQVFKENPDRTVHEVRRILEEALEAECHFIPKQPYDPISHADGILRFINEDLLLVNDYSVAEPAYGRRLLAVLRKLGLNYELFPYAIDPEKGTDGVPSAVGVHLNFAAVEGLIVLPTFGVPSDESAVSTLERIVSRTKIIPLRCEALAREGGVLNCVSYSVRRNFPLEGKG